jgi:hypothetical protein
VNGKGKTRRRKLQNAGYRIFLLSPANIAAERGRLLLRDGAGFELASRLREGEATLGETFAFISGLYFRGKLAYALAFASPPPGLPPAFVITGGQGLVPPDTRITTAQLREMASIPIDLAEDRYRLPLEQHCRILDQIAGADCEFVLLGSLATPKYLKPIAGVLRHRLLFPDQFIGLGDFSRGGLMLRCAREGLQLRYSPVSKLTTLHTTRSE